MFSRSWNHVLTQNPSIDNGDKLSEKVQEALAVYNEYVKNSGDDDDDAQEPDGAAGEGGKEGEPEAAKA